MSHSIWPAIVPVGGFMDRAALQTLLEGLVGGTVDVAEAMRYLGTWPAQDLAIATLDAQRPLRNGFSETVFCQGKSPEHLLAVFRAFVDRGQNVLGTRCTPEAAAQIHAAFPNAHYDAVSRCVVVVQQAMAPLPGRLSIVAAGTADLCVAEEARRTAAFCGVEASTHYDVGVAGLHRLLQRLERLRASDVSIVVAGMEGALPSVLGGLVAHPIVAVPTSIGYGTNLHGLTPLFAMLNSCAEGVTVVNIDNGFGAACAALRILRLLSIRERE